MEREDDIKVKIGASNFDRLIKEVSSGRVSEYKMKRLALSLPPTVHGVFEEGLRRRNTLEQIFRDMLGRFNENQSKLVS